MNNLLSTRSLKRYAVLICLIATCAAQAEERVYDKSVPAPSHKNITYGPHDRNVMDLWLAESDEPTPIVMVIHGGGWLNGSKEMLHRFVDVNQMLTNGISVAAINYRLIKKNPSITAGQRIDTSKKPPVHLPLSDAARALQFIRSKAVAWNVNTDRIGATGGSAGACSTLWLATHDDMADPDSKDPVAQQSTRLFCAASQGAQTTLDPKLMKQWTPNSKYGGHAFGLPNFKTFLDRRDDILPWIKRYSPYAHVSKDDPPIYMKYFAKPAIGKRQGDPTHTANFGVKFQERCQSVGVSCEMFYPGIAEPKHESPTAFLITMLK